MVGRYAILLASLSILITACQQHSFDRAAAVAQIEERLAADRAWKERYAPVAARKKKGEEVGAEIESLKAERPRFTDLQDDALRVVEADPADDAAFHAITLIMRTNGMDDPARWPGSRNEARQKEMIRVLLSHHLQRPDFLDAVYLYFGDSQGKEYVAFWNEVFERSPHREVRARAARSLLKHYAQIIQRDYSDMGALAEEAQRFVASVNTGGVMPAMEAATIDGGKDSLASYRGKIVLLDFWATWCGACLKDHPKLLAFKEELAGKPFEIVSISVDEKPEHVVRYRAKVHPLPWPQWYVGPHGEILNDVGVQGYPTYVLVGSDGTLLARGTTRTLPAILDEARKYVVTASVVR